MKFLIALLALVAVTAHVWFSRQLHDGENEIILKNHVQPVIGGLGDVSIRYEYLDGFLEGTVSSVTARKAAEVEARKSKRAGRIFNQINIYSKPTVPTRTVVDPPIAKPPIVTPQIVPPKISPNVLITLVDGQLILKGRVPDREYSQKLETAAARLKQGAVRNQLNVDSNTSSPGWLEGMPGLFSSFFSGADAAELEARPGSLRLKRPLRSVSAKNNLFAKARRIGLPLVDQVTLIRERPARLLAELEEETRVITLSGDVSSITVKDRLEVAAATNDFEIINNINVSDDIADLSWTGQAFDFLQNFFKGAKSGELEITANRVRINREVDDWDTKQSIASGAKSLFPGGNVVDQLRFPDRSRDFNFAMKRTRRNLNLSGWLPEMAVKKNILKATQLKFPGLTIEDELKVAPNVTMPDWGPSLPDFIGSLDRDFDGSFGFDEKGINLKGIKGPARTKLTNLAEKTIGEKFPSFRIPKFGFDLKRKNKKFSLDGWLPDTSIKTGIVDRLKLKFPSYEIEDNLEIDPDISMPDWAPSLPDFIGSIDRDFDGGITFDQKGINLKGIKGPARTKLTNLAGKTIGEKFPTFSLPKFGFDLKRKDKKFSLDGWLPDMKIKTGIVDRLKTKFPSSEIEDNLEIDPEISMPKWGASLPEFIGSIKDWTGIDSFGFDEKGANLDDVPESKKLDLGKLVRSKFGRSFPAENLPLPTVPTKPPLPAYLLAILNNESLVLAGRVPTADMKKAISTAAVRAKPRARITNKLVVDPLVQTPGWGDGVSELLGDFFITESKSAEFEIDMKSIRMKRVLRDNTSKKTYTARAKSVFPAGKFLDQLTVVAPTVTTMPPPVITPPSTTPKPTVKPVRPAKLKASFSSTRLRLEGEMPDQAGHDAVLNGAATAFPGVAIDDKLEISPEVFPTPWLGNLGDSFKAFSKHAKEGNLYIEKSVVKIGGIAKSSAAHNRLLANLSSVLPKEMEINDRMKVAAPCPENKTPVEPDLPTFVVYYATGSSRINVAGQQEIKEAVETIAELGRSPSVLVKGFADSQGNAAANKRLSDKRAKGVVDSLAEQNIDPDQIRYIGVGQAGSRGGANKNDRRVEVIVVDTK